MATIIGEVRVTPASPRPGQTVTIEVFDVNGVSLVDRDGVTVLIDGIPGARRKVQYDSPGRRKASARAVRGDVQDRAEAAFAVAGPVLQFTPPGCGGRQRLPALLHVQQSPDNPYRVRFTLGEPPRRGPAARPGTPAPATRFDPAVRPSVLDARQGSLAAALGRALRNAEASASSTRLPGAPGSRAAAGAGRRRSATAAASLGTPAAALGFEPRFREPGPVPTVDAVSAIVGNLEVGALFPSADLVWDFGDGVTMSTPSLEVEHDYSRNLEPGEAVMTFEVTCRAGDVEVTRTLTLHSAYGISRQLGVICPPAAASACATKSASGFIAQLSVSNIEHEPITLTHRAVTPLTGGPDALASPAMVRLAAPITIPARTDAAIGTFASFGEELPWDAAGFDVRFAGSTGSGVPVRFGAAFDIPRKDRWWQPQYVVEHAVPFPEPRIGEPGFPWPRIAESVAAAAADLGHPSVAAEVIAAAGTVLITSQLHQLRLGSGSAARAAHTIIGSGIAADAGRQRVGTALFGGAAADLLAMAPPQPGPVLQGQLCDPENLTAEQLAEADARQLVCQRTWEDVEALLPGRFMNARKGDVVLSPGGPGLVGSLLRRVSPAQRFSHSGIMTRNFDEVTHSTASEDRIRDYLVGSADEGSDGIRPDVVRWMWPGVVAQPVEAAINGEPWTDPENGRQYSIASFSAHAVGVTDNDAFVIVPPMVVKPDPMQETAAVRGELHAIAAAARAEAARPNTPLKGHYRLYCYTDPTIGETDSAPAEAGWAQGTFPSVCSSFIWMMAKRQGAHLETDQPTVMPGALEAADVAAGAEVMPTTPDGLYRYTAAERLAAAQWLYDELYHEAHEKAGWFGVLFTDAADDLASEVVNTFAADDPDKDSDVWKQATDASAVSPDNILWWDGPDRGGLYGYAEPLIYREPRVETYTISRWQKVIRRTLVTGRVTLDGAPVPGATVTVYEGKTDLTDASGSYALRDVPVGHYQVKASAVIQGVYYSQTRDVTLTLEDEVVDLALAPPADSFRLAKVVFDFDGRDSDWGTDQTVDPGPEYRELELGPDRLTNQFTRTYKWGGEVRCEYTFDLSLLADNSIRVQVACLLYEKTSEDNNDLNGQGVDAFTVPVGQTAFSMLVVRNTSEDEPDTFGRMAVAVENARNDN